MRIKATDLRIYGAALLIALMLCGVVPAQDKRGAGNVVKVKNPATGKVKEIQLYEASYALVIGESKYTNGWDNLPGVKTDVAEIESALKANGFTVESALDLNSKDLQQRISDFISDYGFDLNHRLLIYYAGHGHTLKGSDGRDLGFIIPVDAPLPEKDALGFRRKAISMDEIQNYARRIGAKHALFVFDSCFSGTLISRAKIAVPPFIQESVAFPVRQFITAGAATQEVPDDSIFRKLFVRAVEGEADTNNDGYITGSELAEFLKEKVTNASDRAQTPQYGKIRDVDLQRGDFVFVVGDKTAPITAEDANPIKARDATTVETKAWNSIKSSSSAISFRDFLEIFPSGKFAAQAKIKLEETAWDAIENSNDKTAVQAFLKEFPTGANASLARLKLRQLKTAATNNNSTTANNNSSAAGTFKAGDTSIAKLPNGAEMSFAYIPAGEFQMGSTNGEASEKPVHKVKISKGYWMGQTEVTQGQWEAVMKTTLQQQATKGTNGTNIYGEGANYPM